MSAQDDVELMETLVKGCERFVAKEVASLMKEVNAQKEQNKAMEARIGVLEVRNQNLDAEVAKLTAESRAWHASCLERMQSAFMSACVSLSNDEITQPLTAPFPIVLEDEDVVMSPEVTEVYGRPGKRSLEETSQIISSLDELPEEFRLKIQPFYKPSRNSTNDKLNECQRAFMKFCAERSFNSGERLTLALAETVRSEGIEERLWRSDYYVENGKDFGVYLHSRLKNEKKKIRARELEKNSSDRMSQLLNEELSI